MKNFLLMTDSLFLMLLSNLHFSNNKERAVHVDINDFFFLEEEVMGKILSFLLLKMLFYIE